MLGVAEPIRCPPAPLPSRARTPWAKGLRVPAVSSAPSYRTSPDAVEGEGLDDPAALPQDAVERDPRDEIHGSCIGEADDALRTAKLRLLLQYLTESFGERDDLDVTVPAAADHAGPTARGRVGHEDDPAHVLVAELRHSLGELKSTRNGTPRTSWARTATSWPRSSRLGASRPSSRAVGSL